MKRLILMLIVFVFLSCHNDDDNPIPYRLGLKCNVIGNNDGNYVALVVLNFDTLALTKVWIQNNNPWVFNTSAYPGHHVYFKVFDFSVDTITSLEASINKNDNLYMLARDSFVDGNSEIVLDIYLP